MKELGKIKERYDFSLDSRQLGLYLFGATAVAALVFVLGVSVGRQWERKKTKGPAEAAAEVNAGQRPAPQSPSPAKPEAGEAQAVAPPAAPPVEPESVPPVVSSNGSAEGAVKVEAQAKPAKQDLTFPKVLTSNSRKTAPIRPEKKASAKTAAYAVQVGAYSEKVSAREMADKLKKKGYGARMYAVKGKGGRYVYKVRIGGYSSRDEAKAAAKKLERSQGIMPYVTLDE